ncbi:CAP domain-containing protein [Deinococcus soli (ex Cha et al. 2016)]|uniref:CAP domain-containing protein n=1 Tax=Deinococcus soli (ex Cha et al. 2016) TaxID=1309411 RepID=UPI00166AB476|nr:CAP domain-containing protein [Deinococcus soli (ex Cha et al. 2016)]GGB54038.1 hypothetical protein GCM10008019_07110 [Deinococcus soli (ex Cha et al. 2016)]
MPAARLCLTLLSLLTLGQTARAQGSELFRVGYSASADHLAPLTVTLRVTHPAGHTVTWAYGDGATGSGAQVTHTYYRPGTYQIQVSLLNAQGRVVGRTEIPMQVRGSGAERAELTVLHAADGTVRLSDLGSVLYRPEPVRVLLNGREVSGAGRLGGGANTATAQATTSAGQTVQRTLTLTGAALTTSLPFDSEVLRLTNQARAQGWNCDTKRPGGPARPPLKGDATLDVAAQAQSAGMALYGYFDHASALDGSTPMRRVQAAGMNPTSVAENIAAGQQTPQEVVDAWLRSPGHCRNIMGDFTLVGLSYVQRPGTKFTRYWTQVFARP